MTSTPPTRARRTITLIVGGARQAGKSAVLAALRDRVPPPTETVVPGGWYQGALLDWLAIDLGVLGGVSVQVHLYVVPQGGETDPTRRLILARAEGLLLVVDSQAHRLDDNIRALVALWGGSLGAGASGLTRPFPTVVFYAKQDLPRELILPATTLDDLLQQGLASGIPGDALRGVGVVEALKRLLTEVLQPRPAAE